MPPLINFLVGITFRALVAPLVFILTLFRRVYFRIQHMDNMDCTMPCSKLSTVSSSSISYRPAENNQSHKMIRTPLAIENVDDTVSTHESIKGNNENAIRNEEQADINEGFSQVARNSNENQSRSGENSSVILVNPNDENSQAENQNNTDEMIVTALAFFLECCDMCVIL